MKIQNSTLFPFLISSRLPKGFGGWEKDGKNVCISAAEWLFLGHTSRCCVSRQNPQPKHCAVPNFLFILLFSISDQPENSFLGHRTP